MDVLNGIGGRIKSESVAALSGMRIDVCNKRIDQPWNGIEHLNDR